MDKVTLDALGISKEDIIERIAEKATQDYFNTGGGSYNAIATAKINELIDEQVQKQVAEVVGSVTHEAMTKVITERDIWGNIGGETSVMDQVIEMTRNYWTMNVDRNGKPDTSSYGDKTTRAQYIMKEHMDKCFNRALERKMEQVVKETKAAIVLGYDAKFKTILEETLKQKV